MTDTFDLQHRVDGPADAAVVVLGPSLGTDLRLFDPQVAALADRYRVVRYDLPGHGGSPAPAGPYTIAGLAQAVISVLDDLGVKRAHHVGVSIGGAIAQQLTIDHPEQVHTLTTIASAARFADPEQWPSRASAVRRDGTAAIAASRPGVWFIPSFAGTAVADRLLAMLRDTAAEGYAGCCEAIATFDAHDDLASIEVPVLAVAGAADPVTPPETVRLISDGVRRGRFAVVDDAAHLLNAEKPSQVNSLIARHLDSASTGSIHSSSEDRTDA